MKTYLLTEEEMNKIFCAYMNLNTMLVVRCDLPEEIRGGLSYSYLMLDEIMPEDQRIVRETD